MTIPSNTITNVARIEDSDKPRIILAYLSTESRKTNLPATGDKMIMGQVTIQGINTSGIIAKLFEQETNLFVKETLTDNNSEYIFTNLSSKRTYYILFIDPNGEWEWRVKSNIIAV